MEAKQIITFHYSKNCQRSKSVDSSCTLFCLHAPEEITISGIELKTVDLQNQVILPPNRVHVFVFCHRLEKNRVYIQNNDIIDCGGWLKMKLLYQNLLRKITIAKGDRLAYLFVLNTIGRKTNDVHYIKS